MKHLLRLIALAGPALVIGCRSEAPPSKPANPASTGPQICALTPPMDTLDVAQHFEGKESAEGRRMDWWRDARFGMFLHWGLYSIPAGKWNDDTGHAEWIMNTAHIPVEQYEQFQTQFNPVQFDAEAWAKMAEDAGMKYVVKIGRASCRERVLCVV